MTIKHIDTDRIIKGEKVTQNGKLSAGTLQTLVKHLDHPESAMESADQLMHMRGLGLTPSKMYEDKGHKARVVEYIAYRGMSTPKPKDSETVNGYLLEFLEFCGKCYVPPTIGLFATWCGQTMDKVDLAIRQGHASADGFKYAKDCIRNFVEISALEGTVNPIVYFHQNKVYYGAVENVNVNISVEDNTSEITPDEYNARVVQLRKSADNVYRSSDDA